MLLAVALLALPFTTRPVDALDEAAACVRVGDAAGALTWLAERPRGADDQAAATLLRARAFAQLGQGVRAEEALAAYARDPRPALDGVAARVALEVAWGRPVWDVARPAMVLQAAEEVLRRRDLPAEARAEARLRRASLWRSLPARRIDARRELQDLAQQGDAPTLQPPALELLAEEASPDADRRLLVEFGATAEGRRALQRLSPGTLDLAARQQRARQLLADRAYDLADVDYAAIGADPRATDGDRQEAWLARAVMALRLREQTPEAITWLKRAEGGPDARRAGEATYRLGIALGRLARWDEAAAVMSRYVAEHPRGPYALSAGYQVGRLFHQAGRFARAAREHRRFLKKKRPDHDKWLWFLGLVEYRAGRHAAARAVFDAIAPGTNTLVGPKADYWTAKSFLAEGDERAALGALDRLRSRAPLSYYGLLGAHLAHALDPARPALPARPAGLPLSVVLPDLDPWIERLADSAAGPRLRAARVLIRAGEPELAALQVTDLQKDPAVAALGPDRDAFERTLDLALERFGERWRRDARRGLPWTGGLAAAEPDDLRATYPLAWITLARAAGRLHGVSPWWLLAHMLQESRFKAQAASHAGALGPMQVLPRTGRRIAARLGVPAGDFFAARLYEPGLALRHAAWYLAALREELGGNVLLAVAAYNGGPLRFADHVLASRALPFDLLIEEIGAHESRNYVRKVADHLVRFATLYGDDAEREALLTALRPPETVPLPRGEIRF